MLNPLGANCNEVLTEQGTAVLISYRTPVAAFIPGKGIIRTSKRWSNTTSKHISKWLKQYSANVTINEVDQTVLDAFQVTV
jgi:hypothetical protein